MSDLVSGVYAIRNMISGRLYVGASWNLDSRFGNHLSMLRSGWHSNPALQRDWDWLGNEAFEFLILEYCTDTLLGDRELSWVSLFMAIGPGVYNSRIHQMTCHPRCFDRRRSVKGV